jgi:hypothetical protein
MIPLQAPSCRDCKHHEWLNRFNHETELEVCRNSRRIRCVFARAEGAKCGPSAQEWLAKE